MVMVIYHCFERIWRVLINPDFSSSVYDNENNYPYETVNIHIQPLINMIQEKNWAITTKKRARVNYHYSVVIENG